MNEPTMYHQIGHFIVLFQHAEAALNDVVLLLSDTDEEVVQILTKGLGYANRLKATDVLFARFVDLRSTISPSEKTAFHDLIGRLEKLGQRRNDIVHSRYLHWKDITGRIGLIRSNAKLRGRQGILDIQEEEFHAEDFEPDLAEICSVLSELEACRLKVIDWIYPEIKPEQL